jgi:hypothetical protein
MVAETFHADVATISLQWLMLARDAARNEPMMAAMFFGLDAAQTEMLARADLRKIQELAKQRNRVVSPHVFRGGLGGGATRESSPPPRSRYGP